MPWATLVPHVYPVGAPGFPPYSLGARLPRTAFGRAAWRGTERFVAAGVERGRRELDETRRRLGLAPTGRLHGGISTRLCLVGTFPELEYPRAWPEHVHVVGPLHFELDHPEVEPPPGDDPLVLVAPSTSQDPEHRLLRAALEGLADEPVRVLATWNRRLPDRPLAVPPNARLVEWVSYTKAMPAADVILCHGGHGTVVRALSCGTVPVIVPGRRRHERERRPRGVGAAWACVSPAASPRPGRCGWRWRRRSAIRRCASASARSPRHPARPAARPAPPAFSNRSAPSGRRTSVRIVLEREALEAMLAEGCSLEEIGRRVERHPSTVSYWLSKYGLCAGLREKHAPEGRALETGAHRVGGSRPQCPPDRG